MKKNDHHIPKAPIAFLDLDETLVNKDTNSLWLEWRIKKKKDYRGILELLIGLHNASYYRRGELTSAKMNVYFWARTLGMSSDAYSAMADAFFNEKGIHHIYPEAIDLIDQLKGAGGHIVMITGQDDFIAHPFHAYFGMDDCISNRRIIKNKRFIGFESPNCYAEGKISLAGQYAAAKGHALRDCAFFTDSISDLPLLTQVKYPVAVNPDPLLYTKAVESAWQIMRFSE